MSFPRIILFGTLGVFALIAGTAAIKKFTGKKSSSTEVVQQKILEPAKVEPKNEAVIPSAPKPVVSQTEKPQQKVEAPAPISKKGKKTDQAAPKTTASNAPSSPLSSEEFPAADRIYQLFTTGQNKLPIVETIVYSSSVPWLKGRPAWVADYASHYQTSRHFIARSLNGKPDYFNQKVTAESKFNVFRKDKKIQFYLLVDVSRCKMGFYYIDLDTNERVLLKTYTVGMGRTDPNAPSGTLTPIGKYSLGNKIAVYRPGTTGFFQDQKVEMISVFGTRWIPFGEELGPCSATAKGFGIHGAPWSVDTKGNAKENKDGIGKFDSDGCIRLSQEDMEELFAIVITKPTVVEIVKDFHDAKPPGVEVASPRS